MEKIYIKTHGCSNNFAESEAMAWILENDGFSIVGDPEDADALIVNCCTVKGETIPLKTIRHLVEEFPYKKIVIAGCITKNLLKEGRKLAEGASFVSTHNIDQIREVVEETLNDNPIEVLEKDGYKKAGMPKKRNNPVVGIVPISTGCNQGCTYCSVILIKGKLYSYPEEKIIEEAQRDVLGGCKELWITSQDNGSYGADKGKLGLPGLISKIAEIPGDFRIRIGMINPYFFKQIADDMINVFGNPKVFKFLHLPVQSGCDAVLERMGRRYIVSEFKEMVEKIRIGIPDVSISTDIIVGFPGENVEDFQKSIDLIKEVKPDVLNISRYIERPGTKAMRYKDKIPGEISKERSSYLTKTFEWIAFEKNRKWANWEGPVLIDEYGKEGTMIGRNDSYKPVVVEGKFELGKRVNVKIERATQWDLRGIVLH